ncbi:MAG: TPM domain-containing protein [Myxococcota bacterium]
MRVPSTALHTLACLALALVACAAPGGAAPIVPSADASQSTPGTWTPAIDAPVVDLSGQVSPAAEARLGETLRAHRDATGVQIAVLVVDTLGGEPIEDFSLRVAEAWAGGSAERDDGMLVTFAAADRRMRIEVGYGLEAQVPDGLAKQILDDAKPDLRAGDWDAAVEGVVGALVTQTAANAPPPGDYVPREEREARERAITLTISLLFTVLAILAGYASGRGFRKPRRRRKKKKGKKAKAAEALDPRTRLALRFAFPVLALVLVGLVLSLGLTPWTFAPVAVYGLFSFPYGRNRKRQLMALIFFSIFALVLGAPPTLTVGLGGGQPEVALGIFAGLSLFILLLGIAASTGATGGSYASSGSSTSYSSSSSSTASYASSSYSSSSSSSSYSGGGGSYGGGGASSSW